MSFKDGLIINFPKLSKAPKTVKEFSFWFRNRAYPAFRGTKYYVQAFKYQATSNDFLDFLEEKGIEVLPKLKRYEDIIDNTSGPGYRWKITLSPGNVKEIERGFLLHESKV